MRMDYGHWIFPFEFDVNDWYGFVYRIVEVDTDRHYIGKKQLWATTRKKISGRKNRKVIKKESKWREYTGSSTHLNAAIAEKGKENFRFYIESLHTSKASLSYEETRKHILEDVLRAKFDDGTPRYFNRQIGHVKFIPPDQTPEEAKMRIDNFLIEHKKII
jgi:hypothetical protein